MTTNTNIRPSFPVRATRALAVLGIGIALGSSWATLNHSARAVAPELSPSPVATVPSVLPPCASEDSQDCYWLASEFGNGSGRSFIDVAGETIYLDGLDK